MLKHLLRRKSAIAALAAMALLGAACGGNGDDSADEPVGDPNHFTIWAPTQLERPVEGLIARFEKRNPDITIEAVYAPGSELNDRLLVGERPDLYVGTALNLQDNADGGIEFNRTVLLGADPLELIVPTGNPRQVADLSVFGPDPTSESGLCPQEVGCGRAARELLERARITPEPDSLAPSAQLVQAAATQLLDAALVYRSQAAKARAAGTIEYVPLPSTQQIGVEHRIGVLVPGEAADRFLADLEAQPPSIQRILARVGLASLEESPQ